MKWWRGNWPKILATLVISVILERASSALDSSYLGTFIDANLVTLLLALLAINITTISIVVAKLEQSTRNDVDAFRDTINALRASIIEQVVLLCGAVIISVFKASTVITAHWPGGGAWFRVALIATLLYAITILQDTADAALLVAQVKTRDPE